ncbi:MAG: (2Fe-2S)-binding protein [Acidimicrobiales bacterium]|nr:(2Fe-2S)-binding protein [Acidimicrobiales bacterium]
MYVCSCRVVTSNDVGAAIASGAASIDEIARDCGAGSRCGGCWPTLTALLDTWPEREQVSSDLAGAA